MYLIKKGEVNMEKIEFETVLVESAKLPMVKIDRELFLRKELRDRYSKEIVERPLSIILRTLE